MTMVSDRLRLARAAAGYESARMAADRFGWNYSTYAGHENGSRQFNLDRAADYARAFGVDAAWLLTGQSTRLAKSPAASPSQADAMSGFCEPSIAPFRAQSSAAGKSVEALAATLAPGWRHIVAWQTLRDWPAYQIAAGDILLTGTPPTEADGDIVVATWSDPDAVTLLAQRCADTAIPAPRTLMPKGQAAIMGTLALVIRPPAK